MRKSIAAFVTLMIASLHLYAQSDQVILSTFTSGYAESGAGNNKVKANMGVIAVDVSSFGANSVLGGFLSYTVNTSPPTRVLNLVPSPVDTTQITMGWQASVGDTAGFVYKIYRSLNRTSGYTNIASPGIQTLNYTSQGLTRKTTYYYYLTAQNQWGTSYASDTLQAATHGEPDTPGGFTAILRNGTANKIDLTWSASGFNPANYKIFRSLSSGSGFTILQTVSSSVLSYTDSTGSLGTPYFYYVTAANNWGESSPTFTQNVTTGTLTISFSPSAPTVATIGSNVPVAVTTNATLAAGDTIRLYFKKGGEPNYTSLDMTGSGGLYQQTIPSGFVTERGVSYFVRAKVGSAAPKYLPDDADPAANPYSILVTVSSTLTYSAAPQPAAQPEKNDIGAYRLISFPLELTNNSFDQILGTLGGFGTRGTNWELYNYTKTKYDGSNFQNQLGQGYWFITTRSNNLKSGTGTTISTNQSKTISIQSGWYIIANPFNFDVAKADIQEGSGVSVTNSKLYYWTVSGGKAQYLESTVLKPWQAYFINNSGSAGNLFIPPKETQGLGKLFKAGFEADPAEFERGEWQVQLAIENNEMSDNSNFVGMLSGASNELDESDYFDAPRQPGDHYLRLYFPHSDWAKAGQYGYDFRQTNETGAAWDFEIAANSGNLNLSVPSVVNIPGNFTIKLIDKDLEMARTVQIGDKILIANKENKDIIRHYRLLIGTEQFLKENDFGIQDAPQSFTLSQNYPNPFNPTTTIRFDVPRATNIKLKIYNVLGQEVTTLANGFFETGRHSIIWNGKDNLGHSVASGVYLYRLEGGGFSKVRKMTYLK